MDSNIDPDTANTVHLNDLSPWESTPTLTYLTNPIYKTDVSKKQKTDSEVAADEATDRRFYRKRIMELTRSMFKKPHPDRELREMFDDYISSLYDADVEEKEGFQSGIWEKEEYGDPKAYEEADKFISLMSYLDSVGGKATLEGNPDINLELLPGGDIQWSANVTMR